MRDDTPVNEPASAAGVVGAVAGTVPLDEAATQQTVDPGHKPVWNRVAQRELTAWQDPLQRPCAGGLAGRGATVELDDAATQQTDDPGHRPVWNRVAHREFGAWQVPLHRFCASASASTNANPTFAFPRVVSAAGSWRPGAAMSDAWTIDGVA